MTLSFFCFSYAIIRITEEFLRFCMSWIRSKTFQPKKYAYNRISAIVSPELHARIRAHVLLLNTTITAFILTAITEKLKREHHE